MTGKRLSKEKYQALFNEVKESIDMNMRPTIVFTHRGAKFMTHAVLVSHYETLPDGSSRLCLREKCRNDLQCPDED
jgi:hypothetical protein